MERKNNALLWGVGAVLVLLLLNLLLGATELPAGSWRALLTGDIQSAGARVLLYVRLPRTLAAFFAGWGLASAGVLIQKVLGNPLAGPNLIGVNAGAGFGTTLCLALFPTALTVVPVFAFAGALAAALTVACIARRVSASRVTVVLAGAALGTAFSAGSDTLHTLFPDAVTGSVRYRIGSLYGVSTGVLIPACLLLLLCWLTAYLFRTELDILSLGGAAAAALGLPVGRYRFLFLTLAAGMAGAAVSFGGLLSFVGLLVPHAAGRLTGGGTGRLLPMAGLTGAALVLLCELPARLLLAPAELPVGIFLSALGVPFFLWLLLSRRGAHSLDE